MAASNTPGCIAEFFGKTLVGVMFNKLPTHRGDLSEGTKALVFDNGRALVFSNHGTYWVESADHVQRALDKERRELEQTTGRLQEVLAMAQAGQEVSA